MVMREGNRTRSTAALASVLLGLALTAPAHAQRSIDAQNRVVEVKQPPAAGEKGGPGLAIRAKKILTVPYEGEQFVDNGVLIVKDGKIEAVGPARTTPIPADYQVLDVGDKWLMPGFIDLHSHIAGTFDINDMVYLTNPGLRVHCSVIPNNEAFKVAVASGVTAVLYIPGSGVNSSGQGILVKTGHEHYEDAVVRDPGSLKIAQAGNPESWVMGVGRSFMNWNTRDMLKRGKTYALRWKAFEEGKGPKPERDLEHDVFRELEAHRTQISTHTQMYQVVMTTITMLSREFGFTAYIDHGEMAGYKAAELAQENGVRAIIGPREIEIPTRQFIQWTGSNPEAILGIAAEYHKRGVKDIGFNTDAPVVPEEELLVQATTAARYGFPTRDLEAVRGLTIVPAVTAGIANKVGCLQPGRDADVLVIGGDPADPRCAVESVLIDGKRVYDAATERRRW
ncbi:MAG: amidohydrolase family protein [Planctomycetes bacterium]|nr:amidohydrolase family protein [Planctomycetota bacterium]